MVRLIVKTFADRERGVFSKLALARSYIYIYIYIYIVS